MSDYMFMLDSHLTGEQSKALAAVRDAAEFFNVNLFLTGGAMRDMMGGFSIRDLDFTIESGSFKSAKALAQRTNPEIVSHDEVHRQMELRFPGNVSASISITRQEKHGKPGSKPQILPATIHEDLRGRDFTVNAIALSLGKASRGLLLDPSNGLGDLTHKELRTVTNYSLYDDPSRILRMIRLRTRLGFTVDERTMSQYRNVREANLETKISPAQLEHELRQIALDPLAGEILKALEEENLIQLFSPVLVGPKLNLQAFQRLQKARQSFPFGIDIGADSYSLFLFLLQEKLTAKERAALANAAGIPKPALDAAAKLDAKTSKVEKEIANAKISRPSGLYAIVSKVPGEILLLLLMRSGQRLVIDRVKNYLQKYLPAAQEITEKAVIERGAEPGTPKFFKLQQQMIAERLDARPKKIAIEEPLPPPPPVAPGRRSAGFR